MKQIAEAIAYTIRQYLLYVLLAHKTIFNKAAQNYENRNSLLQQINCWHITGQQKSNTVIDLFVHYVVKCIDILRLSGSDVNKFAGKVIT